MDKSTQQSTIFYAWQSDTPKPHNRNLIEKALKEACGQLRKKETIPYEITVTSDTKGVPGFCDIPAAILEKIEAADAVVLDLTFVAKTVGESPKYCPNPNVLFELGYAFHAVGWDRLICVMNEAHGPLTAMLFDVAHRRHPVDYSSPDNGKPQIQIIQDLAAKLCDALEPTVLLGPRSVGIDAEEEFSSEAATVHSHWQSTQQHEVSGPTIAFSLRPASYQERRWQDPDSLEELVRSRQIRSAMDTFPPSQQGTDVMQWGLYNGHYRGYLDPSWAMTYAGLFWSILEIGAPNEYERSQRDISLDRTDLSPETTISGGGWIDYRYVHLPIVEVFRFAASFASAFHDSEQLRWSATARGLKGTRLASSRPSSLMPSSRRCASSGAQRGGTARAVDFASKWPQHCVDFLHEMFGMFDVYGQRVGREQLQQFVDDIAQNCR